MGDQQDTVGAVELYHPTIGWTGICADSNWRDNKQAAETVCAQLGYLGGTPYVQRYVSQMYMYFPLDDPNVGFSHLIISCLWYMNFYIKWVYIILYYLNRCKAYIMVSCQSGWRRAKHSRLGHHHSTSESIISRW